MKEPASRIRTLRDHLITSASAGRFIAGVGERVDLCDLLSKTSLQGLICQLYGRSILLATHDQLTAALAVIELDGFADRLVLWPPGISAEHLIGVVAKAGVDAIVTDDDSIDLSHLGVSLHVRVGSKLTRAKNVPFRHRQTEWVLLTSGTTGAPKMLGHNLASLTAAIKNTGAQQDPGIVWGTFYDIRRYGGLQILLRALLGRGSLVLSSADESPTEYLLRLAAHSVTHLTGTPSHWRRALMSPAAQVIAPRYVRLSGEIADQAILNRLRSSYPNAAIGHAYASTEAGVGFEVNDGLEGFPASLIGASEDIEIKIEGGSLRIRSARAAARYVGENAPLSDAEGFVDTGDMVNLRGDRYYFLGRRSGMINVGGQKVYPEEVEALLNRHPAVHMSCVRPRRSSITGSLVVADVVLNPNLDADRQSGELKDEILRFCRQTLPRHMIPTALNFVPALTVAATGKVARHNA
jgi:acyl-coenzyme A synthetase/AMP-(fatty) acid ligase